MDNVIETLKLPQNTPYLSMLSPILLLILSLLNLVATFKSLPNVNLGTFVQILSMVMYHLVTIGLALLMMSVEVKRFGNIEIYAPVVYTCGGRLFLNLVMLGLIFPVHAGSLTLFYVAFVVILGVVAMWGRMCKVKGRDGDVDTIKELRNGGMEDSQTFENGDV